MAEWDCSPQKNPLKFIWFCTSPVQRFISRWLFLLVIATNKRDLRTKSHSFNLSQEEIEPSHMTCMPDCYYFPAMQLYDVQYTLNIQSNSIESFPLVTDLLCHVYVAGLSPTLIDPKYEHVIKTRLRFNRNVVMCGRKNPTCWTRVHLIGGLSKVSYIIRRRDPTVVKLDDRIQVWRWTY